jgi:hypothetical protein
VKWLNDIIDHSRLLQRNLPKADIQQPNFAVTLAALPLIDNQGSIRVHPAAIAPVLS